jgi:DNA-directed RNA polymerase specialized sigma24 family protein
MDERQFKLLSEKMDAIIKLLALKAVESKELKDQVLMLSALGFQPKQIAEIIGKTPNHIRVLLHELRKENACQREESKDSVKPGESEATHNA